MNKPDKFRSSVSEKLNRSYRHKYENRTRNPRSLRRKHGSSYTPHIKFQFTHRDKICQSASNQLNALTRYLGKNEKKGLDDSLIYSNFI